MKRVAIAAALLAPGALWPASASATFPGANGKIFYSSNLAGPTRDLYRINPDGSGAQRLTGLTAPFDQGDEDKPSVSPDGKTIALVFEPEYQHGVEETYDIYLVNRDGSGRIVAICDSAASLPTCRRTYASRVPSADQPARSCPGSDRSRCVATMPGKNPYDPYWSPNSQRIVFTAQTPTESEVWVMNRDGTGKQQLTDGHIDLHATWSPNGAKVVFASDRDVGIQLFTMPVTGGPVTEVTKPPAGAPPTLRQWRPYWDPTHPG